jgi:hypothetical protein
MILALKVLLAAVATTSLLAVIHFFFMAIAKPQRFLQLKTRYEHHILLKAYYCFLLLGWCAGCFAGARMLLFWIPSSWGAIGEDGGFISLRDYLAAVVAFFSIPILMHTEKNTGSSTF